MSEKNRQLDLFVALIGDVPFRDEREAMSVPLVALSKNKRTRIEWHGPSGQRVLVSGHCSNDQARRGEAWDCCAGAGCLARGLRFASS